MKITSVLTLKMLIYIYTVNSKKETLFVKLFYFSKSCVEISW